MNSSGKVSTPATPLRPYPDRWPGWARFLVTVMVVCLALAAGEAGFYYRDRGAFPRANFYVEDPELGVRLIPGATERLALGGHVVTQIRINRDGYRGDALPPPGPNDILVVGDAQVFGLGVEEREAFAAALERAIGAPVMNGGVPTYGPPEYHQVIAEQLVKRHPKTVIIALNLADDLFELDHRDRDRNAVSDGWAVARAKAPAEIREFPGRELMFRRSHLWFAIEKAHNDAEPGGSTDDITGEPPAVPDAPWNALVTAGELGRAPGTDPPLGAYLRDVKQLVSGAGARLVVVILPLDVQVSPAAWPHHHTRPVDLAPSQAFTAALVELCHTIGVAVLDATPVLVAAGPGAFQDRASLLAPPGHAALAAALAHTLAEPPAN